MYKMILLQIPLHRVTLLDDTNRIYFYIASVSVGPKKTQKYQNIENNCQEWVSPDYNKSAAEHVYRIKVSLHKMDSCV